MVKLLLTALAVFSPFVPQNQVYSDFDTFQTEQKFNNDFSDIVEKRVSFTSYEGDNTYSTDYKGDIFYYYAFPINYNLQIYDVDFPLSNFESFYSNSFYNFYNVSFQSVEMVNEIILYNYIGSEYDLIFMAFSSVGMSEIIMRDKLQTNNDLTIFGSFYKFFSAFFPASVVGEYQGIFTAITIAFILFLLFGFIFFLFRTIRRLIGFK